MSTECNHISLPSSGLFPIFCCFMVWGHSNDAIEEMEKGSREMTEPPPHQYLSPNRALAFGGVK